MSNIIASQFINTYKTIDELKQALSRYDNETLLDALVYVIDGYIINNEKDAGVNESNINDKNNSSILTKHESFCSLISQLKRDYSFSELKSFTIEDEKVFFNFDDRKVEVKGMTSNAHSEIKMDLKADEPDVHGETYKRFSNLEIE
ncbi:MAG: hypothetical protein FWF73_01440 [Spirochaetes bacterium]|nr:hypothetical protein [Spirochaetota bacterium]